MAVHHLCDANSFDRGHFFGRLAAVLRLAFLAGLILGTLARTATACTVCIPLPQATAADQLLAADAVVLARENPDEPFKYKVIEVLVGDVETPEIDLFLSSSLRRQLAYQPERSVILIRENGKMSQPRSRSVRFTTEVAKESRWRSLGFATERYEKMIRDVLLKASEWGAATAETPLGPPNIGAATPTDRVRFFMPYLSDLDDRSRLLAYLEVGRAPYNQIRAADEFVEPAVVRAFLTDISNIEWQPLYILLLGMNATAEEKNEIRAVMTSRLLFRSTSKLGAWTANLWAWTAALIEIDGEEALDWLDQNYLERSDPHNGTITEILNALSVHGANGRSELRSRIALSYALALKTHPNASAVAAIDLTTWRDRRFTGIARDILSRDIALDPATAFALENYAALHEG